MQDQEKFHHIPRVLYSNLEKYAQAIREIHALYLEETSTDEPESVAQNSRETADKLALAKAFDLVTQMAITAHLEKELIISIYLYNQTAAPEHQLRYHGQLPQWVIVGNPEAIILDYLLEGRNNQLVMASFSSVGDAEKYFAETELQPIAQVVPSEGLKMQGDFIKTDEAGQTKVVISQIPLRRAPQTIQGQQA